MNWADLAQVVGMFAMAGAFGYWGGQVHAMLKSLERLSEDHEDRLRRLELGDIRA